MQFQRHDRRHIIRLESGEPVIETLSAFLRSEGVVFATVSAIGAVSQARLAYWNAESRKYEYTDLDEQVEVLSFMGNCALREGEPFLHVHAVLGRRDLSVLGGHIVEATAHPTLEVCLFEVATEATAHQATTRGRDEVSGLYLLDLPERFASYKASSLIVPVVGIGDSKGHSDPV